MGRPPGCWGHERLVWGEGGRRERGEQLASGEQRRGAWDFQGAENLTPACGMTHVGRKLGLGPWFPICEVRRPRIPGDFVGSLQACPGGGGGGSSQGRRRLSQACADGCWYLGRHYCSPSTGKTSGPGPSHRLSAPTTQGDKFSVQGGGLHRPCCQGLGAGSQSVYSPDPNANPGLRLSILPGAQRG